MISDAEAKTRAAIVWVRGNTEGGDLVRCPPGMDWRPEGIAMRDGRRIKLPSLYHSDAEHEVVATLTQGGAILRIIDSHEGEWSTTFETRLPREFRLEKAA